MDVQQYRFHGKSLVIRVTFAVAKSLLEIHKKVLKNSLVFVYNSNW